MLNFFKKSSFGLNISDYSIEAVSLEGSIKNPRLLAMGRVILEPGIVEDGRIIKKEKLAAALTELIRKPKLDKLETKRFIFALPESKTFIHFFELPESIKEEKIKTEVELRAAQNFPFTLKDLYYDFKAKNREVILVAVPKHIAQDYLELFKKSKIKPVALEIESLSLARSLINETKEPVLIADIGARTTNFSIFDQEGLKLSITIEIAGNQFTKVLADKLKVSFSEAETLKKEIGLNPGEKEGKVFLILQKEIRGIISEINRISKYFQEKEQKSFEKIILTGGSAALPYLNDYLTKNLEKPVFIGNPWTKINIDISREKEYLKEALEINPILYAAVLGSALRGLTKDPEIVGINLLPK